MGQHHRVSAGLALPLGSSRSICSSNFWETPPNPASPAETALETIHSRFWLCLPRVGNKISQNDNKEAELCVKFLSLVFPIFVVSPAGHMKEDNRLCAARRITKQTTNSCTVITMFISNINRWYKGREMLGASWWNHLKKQELLQLNLVLENIFSKELRYLPQIICER